MLFRSELTKLFEEVRRAPLDELASHYAAHPDVKGEIVIVIGPPGEAVRDETIDVDALLLEALERLPAAKAASEVAKVTGLQRRDLYARLLAMKAGD